jgi:hypothetical protein
MAETSLFNPAAAEFIPGKTYQDSYSSYAPHSTPKQTYEDYPSESFPSPDELFQHYQAMQQSQSNGSWEYYPQDRSPHTTPQTTPQARRSPQPHTLRPAVVPRKSSPPRRHNKPSPQPQARQAPKPRPEQSYDADCVVNLIRSQLEFYFSDKNLYEESNSNLIFYMKQDNMWVPLHVVIQLPKIRSIGGSRNDCLEALRTSSLLELNSEESKVRRPGYQLPSDYKVRKSLRRSVLVYGIPRQMTDADVRKILNMHGNILSISFCGQAEGPDAEMGRITMKKKLGDLIDFSQLTCAFVVFESQSQANKCVKARSRSSVDGIRTMHKYDYNKVVKRLGKGMSPNASPLFAPSSTCSPSFTSEQSPSSQSLSGLTPQFGGNPGHMKLSPAMNAHRSPSFKSRSMSRSPIVRGSRSPYNNAQRSPNWATRKGNVSYRSGSPGWKLDQQEGRHETAMRARSSSSQNRRVIVAKGPDNSRGFRWPRNPEWKTIQSTRTAFDVLGTMI